MGSPRGRRQRTLQEFVKEAPTPLIGVTATFAADANIPLYGFMHGSFQLLLEIVFCAAWSLAIANPGVDPREAFNSFFIGINYRTLDEELI